MIGFAWVPMAITTVSASNLNQVVPAMDMFSLPFIFKNEAHFWWYLAQPEAENFVKALEEILRETPKEKVS